MKAIKSAKARRLTAVTIAKTRAGIGPLKQNTRERSVIASVCDIGKRTHGR